MLYSKHEFFYLFLCGICTFVLVFKDIQVTPLIIVSFTCLYYSSHHETDLFKVKLLFLIETNFQGWNSYINYVN